MVGCGGGTGDIKAGRRWQLSESGMAGTPAAALALSLFILAQVSNHLLTSLFALTANR